MKRIFVTIVFSCFVILGAGRVEAQIYVPGYYEPYWDASGYQFYAPEYDPYYELHALHYQLYLPQYQAYPGYPYCCLGGAIVIPRPVLPPAAVGGKPDRLHTRRK